MILEKEFINKYQEVDRIDLINFIIYSNITKPLQDYQCKLLIREFWISDL